MENWADNAGFSMAVGEFLLRRLDTGNPIERGNYNQFCKVLYVKWRIIQSSISKNGIICNKHFVDHTKELKCFLKITRFYSLAVFSLYKS